MKKLKKLMTICAVCSVFFQPQAFCLQQILTPESMIPFVQSMRDPKVKLLKKAEIFLDCAFSNYKSYEDLTIAGLNPNLLFNNMTDDVCDKIFIKSAIKTFNITDTLRILNLYDGTLKSRYSNVMFNTILREYSKPLNCVSLYTYMLERLSDRFNNFLAIPAVSLNYFKLHTGIVFSTLEKNKIVGQNWLLHCQKRGYSQKTYSNFICILYNEKLPQNYNNVRRLSEDIKKYVYFIVSNYRQDVVLFEGCEVLLPFNSENSFKMNLNAVLRILNEPSEGNIGAVFKEQYVNSAMEFIDYETKHNKILNNLKLGTLHSGFDGMQFDQ